ncbi:TPA: hypothetical protein U5489_001414 [Legionella pneumophila]|nr:hypothetical protein [Legionella pneumophila]
MSRIESKSLFSGTDLASNLDSNRRHICDLVEAIPREQFLAASAETLCEHIMAKLVVDPLVLHEDKITMEHEETKIDVTNRFEYGGAIDGRPILVDGHLLRFYIPFTGSPDFWWARPSTFSLNPPRGIVDTTHHMLILVFENTTQTEEVWFKQQLEGTLTSIRQSIAAQLSQIQQYNSSLSRAVQEAIAHRREQLSKLHGLVSSFSIPLVKKAGMPEYIPLEVSPRAQIQLPKVPVTGFKPEPAISDELFEGILANIRHMGATFEGTPQTYQSLGEDGLRDIVLASLNGYYKGLATGEAFRHYGKTDIRIEEDTRSAFVAECKLWAGEKVLVEALNQLLDYLTWRDCKAALILFNKKASGFSAVQKTIGTALPSHESFLRKQTISFVGEWRYVFHSREDIEREVTVHIFCFNLFVSSDRVKRR